MPAHLLDLTEPRADRPKCQRCSKRASVRLRNTWNASNGVFCKPHGEAALKEQLAREDETWRRENALTREMVIAEVARSLRATHPGHAEALIGVVERDLSLMRVIEGLGHSQEVAPAALREAVDPRMLIEEVDCAARDYLNGAILALFDVVVTIDKTYPMMFDGGERRSYRVAPRSEQRANAVRDRIGGYEIESLHVDDRQLAEDEIRIIFDGPRAVRLEASDGVLTESPDEIAMTLEGGYPGSEFGGASELVYERCASVDARFGRCTRPVGHAGGHRPAPRQT